MGKRDCWLSASKLSLSHSLRAPVGKPVKALLMLPPSVLFGKHDTKASSSVHVVNKVVYHLQVYIFVFIDCAQS